MKQYLTEDEIRKATVEELENNLKAMQEEIDQLKEIDTKEGKERFRDLIKLRILSNTYVTMLEFREMVQRGRKRRKDNEEP